MSNTKIRVIVSFFAIPILLLLAYYGKWFFTSFVVIISLIAFYELSKLSESKGAKVNTFWGILGITVIIINSYLKLIENLFLIISIWFLLLLLIELFRNNGSPFINIGLTTIGFLFFSISGHSLIGIRELFNQLFVSYINGGYLIISILGTIWVCDSIAFFGGTKFGKHKLFPRVSPNKSWEGAILGFLSSILTMILFKELFLVFLSYYQTLIISLIIGVIGQIGDLIESLLKRDAGAKDSSNIIPGHGGVYDRFDSLYYSAPFIYFYLYYTI